ncbi:MAG: hypothetical protein OXG82_00300 [Gammaproteobacteria bacterium]|nr:hypothetical protein [Gammaproteobacteria bacterium]
MNEQRKQFIREYVEQRGGVKELSEDEKKALAELAKKGEKDAE